MIGRLRLRAAYEHGRTVLREVCCEFPLVLSRPRADSAGGWLSLVVLTPSGGLLDGDALESDVTIEAGAKLRLRAQAATQIHAGRSSQAWRFTVGADASLDYAPRALVPHARAEHHSRVTAELAPTGSLFVAESVTPGRCHLGEMFSYQELRLDLDIQQNGLLAARERQVIRPEADALACQLGPYSHFAAAYLFGTDQVRPPTCDGLEAGITSLAYGGQCARLLANRAIDLDRGLEDMALQWRTQLEGSIPQLPCRNALSQGRAVGRRAI